MEAVAVKIKTDKIRAEVKENFFYVRCLDKHDVISALIKSKKAQNKVLEVIKECAEKNNNLYETWQAINKVKGIKVDYQSY